MAEKPILTQSHETEGGKIFQITMNRPELHNAVNGEMAKYFLEAWMHFRDDASLTVAVLHGAGDKSFCAGADLTALETLAAGLISSEKPTLDELENYAQNNLGPMGGSRIIQHKPVITVSQGYTYAGGLELFCHGHIRIAEPQALFSVACRRWGVPLVDGGTVYLPRLLSWGAALPLIITGQRIRAKRAYEIGLVWELVKKGEGLARALKLARQICSAPRDALMADLASALNGTHLPLKEAMTLEARNLYPVATSESMKKGVERFNSGERFWNS
jgi:enoyl-CoA hydratase/carnithine racemase